MKFEVGDYIRYHNHYFFILKIKPINDYFGNPSRIHIISMTNEILLGFFNKGSKIYEESEVIIRDCSLFKLIAS